MRPLPRRHHLAIVAALLVALVWALMLASPATARAATPTPAVPTSLPAELEPLASYVPAPSRDRTVEPGTGALGRLMTATCPGTSYATIRTCGTTLCPRASTTTAGPSTG